MIILIPFSSNVSMIGRFAAGSYYLFLRIIFIYNPVKLLFAHFVCFV